jgi:hypothetical protein
MLDFTSEIIIWVGSTVKKQIMRKVFQLAQFTVKHYDPRGKQRLQKVTVSLTYEGFEPELFKQAFKNDWKPFAKPTEDISEEGSEDSKDSD